MSLLSPVSQFQKKTKVLHTCLEAELHLSFQGYNPIARLIRQNQNKQTTPKNTKQQQKTWTNKEKKKKRALQIVGIVSEAQFNILYERWHY